ncbi:MAG: indolepyruvate ferredoxin oxidoreductase subunit alpha [Promethearchaeota archaeon]
MPVYNTLAPLRKQFGPYKEINIKSESLDVVESIFERYYKRMDAKRRSKGQELMEESYAWDLAGEIENALGISLESTYFDRKLAHPFMVAPGKHTRPGNGNILRPVMLRIAEGWAGVVLKTVAGNEPDGSCSAIKHKGDLYWPVLKTCDKDQFISGERGARYDLGFYKEFFLEPSVKMGITSGIPVVPSLICGVPVLQHEQEWIHSLKMLASLPSGIEVDLSPTISSSVLECRTKEAILGTFNSVEDDLKSLIGFGRKIFHGRIFSIKVSGQHRDLLPWLVSELESNFPDDVPFRFTLFNRQISSLTLPWNLATATTAIGGPAVYYHNLHALKSLFRDDETMKRVEVSYSGGVTNGIQAFQAIASSNSTGIQVATALMKGGSFLALVNILGGFALYLDWIANYMEKNHGVDIRSVKSIASIFRDGTIDVASKKFFHPPAATHLAARVNPRVCDGSCKVPFPLDSNIDCPASASCPAGAFIPKNKEQTHRFVNLDHCIGCGNCSETCLKSAITYVKTRLDN